MARYITAGAYVATLMGSGAVISLLLAALLLKWFGADRFGELIGGGIQVGVVLCVVGLGVRLIAGTWVWLKARMSSEVVH